MMLRWGIYAKDDWFINVHLDTFEKHLEKNHIIYDRSDTEEEFDFVKYFYTIAHSGCANIYKIKIDTEYSGPDWYFYESKDYGYGYGSDHWMETLTQKKQKFAKFVAEYE